MKRLSLLVFVLNSTKHFYYPCTPAGTERCTELRRTYKRKMKSNTLIHSKLIFDMFSFKLDLLKLHYIELCFWKKNVQNVSSSFPPFLNIV
jgi:hypothetical protein